MNVALDILCMLLDNFRHLESLPFTRYLTGICRSRCSGTRFRRHKPMQHSQALPPPICVAGQPLQSFDSTSVHPTRPPGLHPVLPYVGQCVRPCMTAYPGRHLYAIPWGVCLFEICLVSRVIVPHLHSQEAVTSVQPADEAETWNISRRSSCCGRC